MNKDDTIREYNAHLKYVPFIHRHSDFDNIFYDSDLKLIRKYVKRLSDLLNSMLLRMERRDTLQVAKSVFDYVSQKEMYFTYPHLYYDCRFGDWRICIGCNRAHRGHHYYVSVSGVSVNARFNEYISEYGYGDFDSFEKCVDLFAEIVDDILSSKLGRIPF